MSEKNEVQKKDPTVFLVLWLGVPMIGIIGYAWYLLNA